MSAATLEWESERRRGMRRTIAISAVAHAAVVAVFVAGPAQRPSPIRLSSVVTVELVAAPPAPVRRPRPRPAPPVPRKVVLPETARRVVASPAPKPRPKPVEEDYDELLEKLRADAGEDRPAPVDRRPPPPPDPAPTPAPTVVADARPSATATPQTGGIGRVAPPEVVAWVRDARIHVRREWVLAAGFRLQELETHVEVELDEDGRVLGEPRVTLGSGNPWYDESVVRAIEKADPLPAPPEAGSWPFVFRPEDY